MGKAKGDVMQQGLIGVRFGRLVVTERLPSVRGGHSMWRCLCDCGQTTNVLGTSLRKGATKSCGCLNRELASGLNLIHGKSDTKTHRIWRGMLERCGNQNNKRFPQYGGRGIKVCKRWQTFENFIADMGECKAGYSIDRINPNGNYEPGNCRWASQKDQQNNRTNNHRLTMNGETHTISEWCDRLGLSRSTVMDRLAKGWSAEKALSTEDFRYE